MSHNPAKDPRQNLQRLPGVKDSVPKNREPLPSCSYTFIAGDFAGLRHLADDLYWFAWQCDHEVKNLSRYVERLIGDGGSWQGGTATIFRNTYGQDAIIINGFARDLCEMARVIDQLALRLAKIEVIIEEGLRRGIAKGYLKWTNSATTAGGGLIVMANPAGGWVIVDPVGGAPAQQYGVQLAAIHQQALDQADRARKNIKTELAALTAPISKALDWYLTDDEYDSGGLLSPSQIKADSAEVKRLQQAYAGSVSGLTAGDFNDAVQDAAKMGGDVKTIGDLMGSIKGLKGSDLVKGVTKTGDTASKVGSVIGDILLLLAVAPK